MIPRSFARIGGAGVWRPSFAHLPADQYSVLEAEALAVARQYNVAMWYVPRDLSGVWQDSAGTTPVTGAGQPIGFLADQQYRAAGPELVLNGTFDANTNGWTSFNSNSQNPASESGQLVVRNNTTSTATAIGAAQTLLLVVGKTYAVSGLVRRIAGDFAHITVINAAGSTFIVQGAQITSTDIQSVRFTFTATETNSQVYLRAFRASPSAVAGEIAGSFDNISVRELPGYHATQATAGNRPTLAALPNGRWGMQFDATNATLSAPVPSAGTPVFAAWTAAGITNLFTSATVSSVVWGHPALASLSVGVAYASAAALPDAARIVIERFAAAHAGAPYSA